MPYFGNAFKATMYVVNYAFTSSSRTKALGAKNSEGIQNPKRACPIPCVEDSMTEKKWAHPEAIMRMRIQGETPRCSLCVHVNNGTPNKWCGIRYVDPCPGKFMDSTVCEKFNDRENEVVTKPS